MIETNNKIKRKKEILFITGLSGSGKTACIQVLLDFGYLILSIGKESDFLKMAESIINSTSNNKIAFVINIINKDNFTKRYEDLMKIKKKYPEYEYKQIFIKAAVDVLLNRYQETRKIHPYSYYNGSNISTIEGIKKEGEIAANFRLDSDLVIDTSTLSVGEAKQILQNYLEEQIEFVINLYSFGFKYGNDRNSDFVFDLRALPNPFYIENLRKKTGMSKKVQDYVFATEHAQVMYKSIENIILVTAPGYKRIGKVVVDIAIACTGGQHRSVSFVERLKKDLDIKLKNEFKINKMHLEKERGNWKC